MDLRRKETKLTVITTVNAGRASNAWRGRHNSSCSVLDYHYDPRSVTTATLCTNRVHSDTYYYDPRSVATPRATLCTNRVPNDTLRRVDERRMYLPVPATTVRPDQAPKQPISIHTEVSPNSPARVLLLDRRAFAEPDTPSHRPSLRRKPHIRRHHRRAMSDSPLRTETGLDMPASPDEWEGNEALTPLIESLAKMYAGSPRTESPYTFHGPDLDETMYSPSVYSVYSDGGSPHKEEPVPQPFVDGPVAAFHDWDNGVHYRDARVHGVPEGRLLAKKVPTIHLRALLRTRREEAGLPVDAKLDSPDDC